MRMSHVSTGRLVVWTLAACLCTSAAAAQNTNWPLERPPSALAAKEVPFPPYEVRSLPNGMQVMMVLHHEQPAVTMHLLVRAGGAQDPRQKEGLAVLASRLLDQGTATSSSEEIADRIDTIGGSLSTGSGPDRTTISTVVMKDSFEFGMEMLADLVRNASFASDEIDRQKEQLISSQQVNAGDPAYIASVVFERLVYGAHPYGLPGSGTPETLAGITREDLLDFHRRYFVPNNMILAIVGDVTSAHAFATVERVFGEWSRRDVSFPAPISPPTPSRRIVVIDKPDAVQTEIRVGGLAIPRKHDEHFAWDLAVRILGGEGANRLHRVLRSDRALTYGASAQTRALKQAGSYVAETNTRTETTAEALELVIREMVRIREQRVSEGELRDAQAYVAGSFPLTIETPLDIASQVLHAVFYELPLEEISTFVQRVQSVTPDDVRRVARTYIRPEALTMVLVGNASAFVPELRKRGLNDFELIPMDKLDLSSPILGVQRFRVDTGRPAPVAALTSGFRLVAAREPLQSTQSGRSGSRPAPQQPASTRPASSDAAGVELLRRVVQARGGLEALESVRSVVADTETVFMDERGQSVATTKTTTYVVYPDKFRVDAVIQDDVISQVYNAGRAWEQSPAGVRELPSQVRDEMAASVRRDTIPLLIAAARGQLTTRVLRDEGSADRRLRVVEVSGAHIEPVRLYVDDDMLIARQAFSATGPDGQPMPAEESFSDYREVDGIRVPFEAAVSRDGRVIVRRALTSVRFNAPLDDAIFEQPQ